MHKIFMKPAVVMLAFGLIFTTPAVLAEHGSDNSNSTDNSTDNSAEQETNSTSGGTESHNSFEDKIKTHQEAEKQKRTELRQKFCQEHGKDVGNIMARMADRGQKQLDLFSTIATRVEGFYVQKGKTLSNYDALVASVNDAKTAAQAAVDNVRSQSGSFDCNANNAKTVIEGFKADVKAEIAALKDYKTAVKNLIVGVKSVEGTESSSKTEGGAQQ